MCSDSRPSASTSIPERIRDHSSPAGHHIWDFEQEALCPRGRISDIPPVWHFGWWDPPTGIVAFWCNVFTEAAHDVQEPAFKPIHIDIRKLPPNEPTLLAVVTLVTSIQAKRFETCLLNSVPFLETPSWRYCP